MILCCNVRLLLLIIIIIVLDVVYILCLFSSNQHLAAIRRSAALTLRLLLYC